MRNFTFLNSRVNSLFLVFFTALLSLNVFAEGTPQVSPDQTRLSALAYLPDNGSGSYLNCPNDNRISFTISDSSTERLYFGFNWMSYSTTTAVIVPDTGAGVAKMYWRIRNASGTVVVAPLSLLK